MINNYEAAWKAFGVAILQKSEWKTRELFELRSLLEYEYRIGTVGELMKGVIIDNNN